ncbi:MAG TPA: SDR family NAD(P)-dependent oxidoreductase [Actinomycetota bacterium]|nr:SDR family NAD(P)-dependent oxidoreductase [Actinomycetota bacterium]
MGGFDGRVALVTGAGSATGIGFACARALGREGAAVGVAATTERIHDRAAELVADGVDAAGFVADLTDPGAAAAMVTAVVERFGRLDVLVNNAGMIQSGHPKDLDGDPVASMGAERFERDLALNLKTAFNVSRAALPGMLERGYGRIVMVSSVTGPVATNPQNAGYAAAKAGMDGLMRTIALECGRRGVTCNSVLPGWIASGSQLEEEDVAGRNTPIGRSGTPEEIAAAVAFLASEAASYVTGHAMVVDGGNTIQEYKGPAEAWY